MASLAACQPSASNAVELGRSPAGLEQVPLTITDASFWMKNTLIPLDMIFVRSDGTIANIATNTVPLSLDPVYSEGQVGAVLEIAGGRSDELGIKAGDKVAW